MISRTELFQALYQNKLMNLVEINSDSENFYLNIESKMETISVHKTGIISFSDRASSALKAIVVRLKNVLPKLKTLDEYLLDLLGSEIIDKLKVSKINTSFNASESTVSFWVTDRIIDRQSVFFRLYLIDKEIDLYEYSFNVAENIIKALQDVKDFELLEILASILKRLDLRDWKTKGDTDISVWLDL